MAALFKVGDYVMVTALKKEGVILEVRKEGTYQVGVGSLTKVCKASELKPLAPDKWKQFSHMKKPRVEGPSVPLPKGQDYRTVDLHGLRLHEAKAVLEKALNDALCAGCERFEIVHGIGTGALMTMVHEYLGALKVVKAFKVDEQNRGTTWVYFG